MIFINIPIRFFTCLLVLISVCACNIKTKKNMPNSNPIQIEKINYKGWSKSIEISNGKVRLVVVPEVGRILHYGYIHQDNLLYINKKLEGIQLQEGKAYVENNKKTSPNIGGDRILANSEPYYEQITSLWNLSDYWINAAPYSFEILSNGIVIKSPVSKLQGIQIERSIKLSPHGSKVTIDQSIHKIAPAKETHMDSIPLTLWNLTKIKPPKSSWLPLNTNSIFKKGYMIPSWSDAENVAANNIVVENNVLKLKPIEQGSQKVGADARGWVAALIDDVLMVERFPVIPNAIYPDGGTNATLYSNKYFTELECLSPEKILSIGDSLHHTITWELHKVNSTDELNDFLNNNLMRNN